MIRMIATMAAAALVWVLLVGHARSQEIDPTAPDWVMVVGCAKTPYPDLTWTNQNQMLARQLLFWEVHTCRLMLMARAATWREVGGGTVNHYPAVRMLQPGDYGK